MDDNDEFVIILHLEEGIGLNLNTQNVVVVAALGGNKLETEIANTGKPTVFHNNLIWETDKKSIKKMKTENLPIKLECFAVTIEKDEELRSLIGYILLPLRGTQIAQRKTISSLKSHWHKLIGLTSEWRPHKPELLLFLTITDKVNFDENKEFLSFKSMISPVKESITQPSQQQIENNLQLENLESLNTSDMLKSQCGIHIQLLQDEGLLQIGDMSEDNDIFVLKLMFRNAKNLESILLPKSQTHRLYTFHYNLLGSQAQCLLTSKGKGLHSIQEKIAIHFRSSFPLLIEYFRKVLYIPIELFYNDTLVGQAKFTFGAFFSLNSKEEFLELYGNNDNTFETEGSFDVDTVLDLTPGLPRPIIEYNFGIKILSATDIRTERDPGLNTIGEDQGGGDGCLQRGFELPPTEEFEKQSDHEQRPSVSDSQLISVREDDLRMNNVILPKPAKSEPIIHSNFEKTDIDTLLIEKIPSKSIPRTFSFNLQLQTIKFTRRPEIGIWQISLHHPKADTTFTITNVELTDISGNLIEFKDLELQLFFSSTTDSILELIECEPCVLSINGPRGVHATAELDNEILLVGTKEKRAGVILMEDQSGEKISMAQIFVYLDDIGISFNNQIKRFAHALPQPKNFMDENVAYKIVEELEEWKIKQQEIFLVELKRKEINHLAHLSAEWQKKKTEQETKLEQKLEQCTLLTQALEEAHKLISEKGVHQLEQERLIAHMKAELEETYSAKLLEFREKAHRIEDDMLHQIKLQELGFRELEMSKSLVEHENEKLKAEIKELESQIIEMKQSFLPREQLSGLFQDLRLLSERLDEVQKSKDFYKDQWAKIIREVHKMKSENLKQMEIQLQQKQNLDLQDFIATENIELSSERNELNFIKDALCSDNESEHDSNIIEDLK